MSGDLGMGLRILLAWMGITVIGVSIVGMWTGAKMILACVFNVWDS